MTFAAETVLNEQITANFKMAIFAFFPIVPTTTLT
jgi:hypothetical protein